jgi:hypothetical protein
MALFGCTYYTEWLYLDVLTIGEWLYLDVLTIGEWPYLDVHTGRHISSLFRSAQILLSEWPYLDLLR